jgi:hypothetical protein
MAEVDRLSNSGLYPALPIADRRSRKDGSGAQPPPDKNPPPERPTLKDAGEKDPGPPKHRIDEYA